jgi:hypothetical protein
MGKHVETIGGGAHIRWTITHGAHTRDVLVEVYQTRPPYGTMLVDSTRPSQDTVQINTVDPLAPDELTVVVLW